MRDSKLVISNPVTVKFDHVVDVHDRKPWVVRGKV
jgi:hypothetical protein